MSTLQLLNAPTYRVIREVNHEALRAQIGHHLSRLTPEEFAVLQADPGMQRDESWDLIFDKVYDRLIMDPPNAGEELQTDFDKAFDAEVQCQIAALRSLQIAA